MRYLKARYGKVHIAKDGIQETLCGHEVSIQWAYEVTKTVADNEHLCKKCEDAARTIDERGRQIRLTQSEVNFDELCSFLRAKKMKIIYLIHEPNREQETKRFARQLRTEGFTPLVAQDFRVHGKNAVNEAIGSSDFSLVLAFDDETVKTCNSSGVAVFLMELKK